jgi:phage tail sheath protein FI
MPHIIQGVTTSTAAFIGQTERGPAFPHLVTSWAEYISWYGDYLDRTPGCTAFRYLPYAVRGFFENGGQRLFIARAAPPGSTPAHASPGHGAMLLEAISPGAWGSNIRFSLRATAESFDLTLNYFRAGNLNPELTERYNNLPANPADPNFAPTIVNSSSRLINLTLTGTLAAIDLPNGVLDQGGDPGSPEPAADQFRSAPIQLAAQPDISLIPIPDDVLLPALRADLLLHCQTLGNRFAILSCTEQEQSASPAQLQPPADSSWLVVAAPHPPSGQLSVPPSGHVAGIYARVDAQYGVQKAPANELVNGIQGLSHPVSQAQQDLLNPKGINLIRDFRPQGRGILAWGARTMSSDSAWRYINIRRLSIYLEQSLNRSLRWVESEPNSEQTWATVRLSASAFLQTAWRNGALAGSKQGDAFFVKCDRTTMTQDDLDNGRLICLKGIAPVKPAEVVIFRIGQTTSEGTRPGHPDPWPHLP